MSDIFDGFYKDKKILVTGHTGFKGSWLSMWLRELGAEVAGFALEPPSKPSLYEVSGMEGRMASVFGDVRDAVKLEETFNRYEPEMVFHMAAQSLVRYSYKAPSYTYETNVLGTVNVLEACRKTPSVRAIVNVTSDKCYDNDNAARPFRENDPMGGHDPYSSSKGCAELVTAAYVRSYFNPRDFAEHGVSLASVRSGNAIGGGDWGKDRLIPDCVKALAEGKPVIIRYPEAVRPWQHVLEPVYGYLLLGKDLYRYGAAFSGGWNFGSDDREARTVRWLMDKMVTMWGQGAAWKADRGDHPYEAQHLRLDCSKAIKGLGWSPGWDLETALANTVDWYKAYFEGKEMLPFTVRQIKKYEKTVERRS